MSSTKIFDKEPPKALTLARVLNFVSTLQEEGTSHHGTAEPCTAVRNGHEPRKDLSDKEER